MEKLCKIPIELWGLSKYREKLESKKKEENKALKKEALKFEKECINRINHDSDLTLTDKIEITQNMLDNSIYISLFSQEFYEEECPLSLINWIWNQFKVLKKEAKNFQNENFLNFITFLQLIFNILNLIEKLQINSQDIITLKLYEKLIIIKKILLKLKIFNFDFLISEILQKWKSNVDSFNEIWLSKKRKRDSVYDYDIDTDADSNSSPIPNINPKININTKKVTFNTIKNNVIIYDINQEPSSIRSLLNNP